MSTMTMNTAAALVADAAQAPAPSKATPARRSILSRFVDAIAESNRRKAEVEVRRILAMRADQKKEVDYALLPFAGE